MVERPSNVAAMQGRKPPHGVQGLPATLPATPISGRLLAAISATADPHPDVGPPQGYDRDVQAEARRVLAIVEPFAAPVFEAAVRAWLAPVLGAVRNPQGDAAMTAWFPGLMLAVGQLEAGAFTIETQRAALQTFDFFPSAADVYRVVSGPAMVIRRRVQVLRRIVDAPTTKNGA